MIGSGILFNVLSMQVACIVVVSYNYVFKLLLYIQYHRYSCTSMDWILSE